MADQSAPRARYGEAFWRAHHEAWKRSDLNPREYCEAQGISLKAFGNWRAKFKAEPEAPQRKLLYRRGGASHGLSHTLCKRARWADLVVTGVLPPATGGLRTRLGSEFRTMMRHCPRPVLVVPGAGVAPQRALLAYDGSPKSEEGLYVASYLAGGWSLSLVVVTVNESNRSASKTQDPARSYLEHHGIVAKMVLGKGPVAQSVLHEADTHASDIIIMGGYGSSPPVEAVLGSVVDEVLRMSRRPVLILT